MNVDSVGTYGVHLIDKNLGIIPREIFDHLNQVILQKYCSDQRYAFVRGEGMIDQPFPGWSFAARERVVRLVDARSPKFTRN